MIWVQHLLGTGHRRRAGYLARAMAERGLEVTLASGGFPVPGLGPEPFRVVELSPLRAEDARYETLWTPGGRPADDAWMRRRAGTLRAAFAAARPDALLVETFPFGRRRFRSELLPLLEDARGRAPRPFVAASIRDVLEPRSRPERYAETVGWVARFFDAVLVHGDAEVLPLDASFPAAADIEAPIRYTGYVAPPAGARATGDDGAGEVLVSAGGGAVGERLLGSVLAARERSRSRRLPWRILVPHGVPDERVREMRARAPEAVTVERNRADFASLLGGAAVSVSAAGYNSLVEILRARTRSVVVPFGEAGEREQELRAAAFAARGWVRCVTGADVSADSLAAAIDAAAAGPRPEPALDLSGAETSARLVEEEIARRRG